MNVLGAEHEKKITQNKLLSKLSTEKIFLTWFTVLYTEERKGRRKRNILKGILTGIQVSVRE